MAYNLGGLKSLQNYIKTLGLALEILKSTIIFKHKNYQSLEFLKL